jgi:hypothetical protein
MQEFAPKNASPPAPPAEHWPNDEDLAAFLDGTLDKAESRRIAEHLATCEECYAIYAGALEFKLESESDPGEVVLFPSKNREWNMRWLIAAAASLAVAMGSWYAFQNALIGPAPNLAIAELAPPVKERAVKGLLWDHNRYRGKGGKETDLDRQSFQIGALLVDFRLSAQAEDVSNATETWRSIGAVVRQVNFLAKEGDRLLAEANQINDASSLRRVAATAEATERGFDDSILTPEYLDFGKWTEAGRLAAIVRDPTFFKDWKNRRFLAYILREKEIEPSPEVREVLEQIAKTWDRGDLSAADFASLAQRFQSVLDQYDFTS